MDLYSENTSFITFGQLLFSLMTYSSLISYGEYCCGVVMVELSGLVDVRCTKFTREFLLQNKPIEIVIFGIVFNQFFKMGLIQVMSSMNSQSK